MCDVSDETDILQKFRRNAQWLLFSIKNRSFKDHLIAKKQKPVHEEGNPNNGQTHNSQFR